MAVYDLVIVDDRGKGIVASEDEGVCFVGYDLLAGWMRCNQGHRYRLYPHARGVDEQDMIATIQKGESR